MKSSRPNEPNPQSESNTDVAALEARLRYLERTLAESSERARGRTRFVRRVVIGAASLAAIGVLVRVGLASAACAQTLPSPLVTMCAGEPAKAANVNSNFQQLVTWMEQKVGTLGSANVAMTGQVRIQTGATSNAAAASGKPLFISAGILDGATGTGGVEIRHDNLTQGIGFGYNTIYAAGSNTSQDLNLQAKGTGSVVLRGNVSGTGGACYTRWGSHGCASGYDEVVSGPVGGYESFGESGNYGASNAECVTDSAAAINTWPGTYYTRLLRGTTAATGMDAVSGQCSICCRASCYTAFATTSCASGYTTAYTGRTGGVEAHSSVRPHVKTMCIDTGATTYASWTSGFSTRLMRHRDAVAGGGANGMEQVSNSCAVCCK